MQITPWNSFNISWLKITGSTAWANTAVLEKKSCYSRAFEWFVTERSGSEQTTPSALNHRYWIPTAVYTAQTVLGKFYCMKSESATRCLWLCLYFHPELRNHKTTHLLLYATLQLLAQDIVLKVH